MKLMRSHFTHQEITFLRLSMALLRPVVELSLPNLVFFGNNGKGGRRREI